MRYNDVEMFQNKMFLMSVLAMRCFGVEKYEKKMKTKSTFPRISLIFLFK